MRLSIHMMVLNGASVVERALRPFATIADEVVLVDTGSTDGTPEVVQHLCNSKFPEKFGEQSKLRCYVAALIKPESHSEMYFRDSPSSWARASTWDMEIPGPFTEKPVLADWSRARNMGVCRCQGDYIIKLDADDEVLDPQNILPALKFLDDHPSIDFLYCPYEICEIPGEGASPRPASPALETISMYDRIWRNRSHIRYTQEIHEYLLGKEADPSGRPNWFAVAQGLRFRDWRDSPGTGVRIPHRNFKVFMREYERRVAAKMDLTPSFLLSTIGEVTEANPNFALSLLRMAEERDPKLHLDAGYLHSLGRTYAKNGLDQHALGALKEATKLSPSSASILLDLGFQELRMGLPSWKGHLTGGIVKARIAGGFNVDHRELRKAAKLLDEPGI